MKLSLVVPCYNEEGNVANFFDEVNSVFKQNGISDYEFVFINDGSTDKTLSILKDLHKLHKRSHNIKILSFSKNFGKEAAIYAGLSKSKGDLVCLIDADLQQRPEVVVEMLNEIYKDEELDCICAYQEKRNEKKLVALIKTSFYKFINKISDVEFVNGASDFRLLKRSMVNAILEMTEFHRFSKGLFSYVGFNTKYIPYNAAEREAGESKWSLKSLFKYALEGIFAFSTMPLKISTFIGFLFSFCSVLYLLVVLIQKLYFGIAISGYATIVILILFLGGVQLFSLGILGEYIAKMYVQVKNRPIYFLKEYICSDDEENY